MKLEQATIKDIARELNVSSSTVSRALKDYPGISDETKRKVKELAEKMNYRPNAIALSLRKSRSFTIGVIIPEVVHFFFSTVISGIEEVAFSRGYNVILTQTNEKLAREKSSVDTMLSNQIDGFLVSYSKETTDFNHFSRLLDQGFPIVFFDRVPEIEDSVNVVVDDFKGSYEASKHLILQGYRRIYHISGPVQLKISKERLRGYQAALEDHGIKFENSWVIECPRGDENEAKEITLEILKTNSEKPDAFFCHNDMAAVGVMMACKEMGLKIPQDIGVVGFSNWQFCTMLDPSLSSVAQPGFKMGAKATEILLDIIEKKINTKETQNTFVLDTELLVRKSSVKI
ncbi:LacI family transcriptional regulator [Algoriphagus boseongensis]|uniref:LacI family transcriptional regulator n=1 Tax=Algoriphagus boseongensis TaxID=1442587 RepID=A0A4R6T9S1_9BACT|nr:LacI family DNA-binding transcriptional regulator [Algoriphagus boseongensis]TDQ18632.1 LacI family transcriptional regulator [Algoriphagus boseongensis]